MPQYIICSGSFVRSITPEVNYCHNDGCDDHPEQLEPVEERDAYKCWLQEVIKRRVEHGNERDNQQYKQPGSPLSPRLSNHS